MVLSRSLKLRGRFAIPYTPPFSVAGPYDPARPMDQTILTQVHCHTNQSDGSYTPAVIVADYLAKGYGALAITDHNKVTGQPAGITGQIVGNELTSSAQHIISVGSSFTSSSTDAQTLVNGVLSAGGQCHVAHPKWSSGMSLPELKALAGHLGFEFHNTHCFGSTGSNPLTFPGWALDWWDDVLSSSLLATWGYSVDDLHTIDDFEAVDVGRLRVFLHSNDATSLLEALVDGDFVADVSNYAVTPGVPDRTVDGVALVCAGATAIEARGFNGALLQSTPGDTFAYDFAGDEVYCRLVAVGAYTEGFGAALSDRWNTVNGSWAATGGVLSQATSTSPALISLNMHRGEDFNAQFDARFMAASKSFGLAFNVLKSTYYYVLNWGGGSGNNLEFLIANGSSTPSSLAAGAFTATQGVWYRVVMEYEAATGTMRAKMWDRDSGSDPGTWLVTTTDATWHHGGFGIRGRGPAEYDNLYLNGFRTYYQPIPVALA